MVRHNNQLPDNLPQLQNLIKRDPESYKEEVIFVLISLLCFIYYFMFYINKIWVWYDRLWFILYILLIF